jgi:hypothetical protein
MKRLVLLVALVMAMGVLAPAAFADDLETAEMDSSAAQQAKAGMIADAFPLDESTAEEIMVLREGTPAVGWGVLFKLQAYTTAGMDLSKFLTADGGYALGQIRKAYLEDPEGGEYGELAYKNFGQLQKASKDKPEKLAKVMPESANKNKDKDKLQG